MCRRCVVVSLSTTESHFSVGVGSMPCSMQEEPLGDSTDEHVRRD